MKIIFALGNPGTSFEKTRHNVGFEMINKLSKYLNSSEFSLRGCNFISSFFHNNEKVLLVKPYTFVNESGNSVSSLMEEFKLALERILVIYDDITIPIGKIRFRRKGSSGGHNGLKNIISNLGSENFARIKIGVGYNEEIPLNEWVIRKVRNEEWNIIMSTENDVRKTVLQWIEEN